MAATAESAMFPTLTAKEIELLRPLADTVEFADGATVFQAGDTDLDLFVVEQGAIEIRNPADDGAVIAVHHPGHFAGDIDLLTGRPVIVTGVARGATRVRRVPSEKIRILLNRVPTFGEKLIVAFTSRRQALTDLKVKLGLTVVGAGQCKETNLVREFLYKNFVPHTWVDSDTDAGRALLEPHGGRKCPKPLVDCGNGKVFKNPS